MKITHYLYNAFIIESNEKRIAIDPGCVFFHFFRTTSLIPRSEWDSISHIFVTHGDPDHYWHFDRLAKVSGAKVILNSTMVRNFNGQEMALGPRSKGVAFTEPIEDPHTLSAGQSIEVDGMNVRGIAVTHGPLLIKFGPFSKIEQPGPGERIGWGGIGFQIKISSRTLVNLGDTLLLTDDWQSISPPDVLMIPIGGKESYNTMDVDQALEAVEIIKPRIVIPTHYNLPALFTNKYCPADGNLFKREVEKLGPQCELLRKNDFLTL